MWKNIHNNQIYAFYSHALEYYGSTTTRPINLRSRGRRRLPRRRRPHVLLHRLIDLSMVPLVRGGRVGKEHADLLPRRQVACAPAR